MAKTLFAVYVMPRDGQIVEFEAFLDYYQALNVAYATYGSWVRAKSAFDK